MVLRVLGTQQGLDAARALKPIINDELMASITKLNNQGMILSDPNAWDGPLALKFRDEWPSIHTNLVSTKNQLEQLRCLLNQILDNAPCHCGKTLL